MNREKEYALSIGHEHLKKFGQYFTDYNIADFVVKWTCMNAENMLDPAVGNSIFFQYAYKNYPHCRLVGYELDDVILKFFGNPANAQIMNQDYLKSEWNHPYDAIICNPPYNKFQAIANRDEMIQDICNHTGVKCSGYTNLYILFLIKSIYQLSPNGRLAYVIPTEFLNSDYGIPVKKILLEKRLIRAIINFQNNSDIYFNSVTTCCILLLDHAPKSHVEFYNLLSVEQLDSVKIGKSSEYSITIEYSELSAEKKWRFYLNQETAKKYINIRPISDFCCVSRGIATGANDYFCLSKSKMQQYNIPVECVKKCICHSADVKRPVFTNNDFQHLSDSDKSVYLLDAEIQHADILREYIQFGIKQQVHEKYLTSRRNPWFSMETKAVAPIWVSSACRGSIKFVRNLAGVKSLTTFHSVYVNDVYEDYTDIIFCYFLTPIAQTIIKNNRKELGNGLNKFQPNDLNSAKMLDITLITKKDQRRILNIYNEIKKNYVPAQIILLNDIIMKYVT